MRITLGIESFTWHFSEESLVSINTYSSKKTDISILSVTDIWLLKKNLKLNTIYFENEGSTNSSCYDLSISKSLEEWCVKNIPHT